LTRTPGKNIENFFIAEGQGKGWLQREKHMAENGDARGLPVPREGKFKRLRESKLPGLTRKACARKRLGGKGPNKKSGRWRGSGATLGPGSENIG